MMNKKLIGAVVCFLGITFMNAQIRQNLTEMSPEKRKELIEKMPPEEKAKALNELKETAVISDIEIPKEQETAFKTIYEDYKNSQKQIKENFTPRKDFDKMSEEEAKKQLDKSFDIGQQLLENRRRYAEKMQKIIPPQQVLKMFDNESRMRGKMMERSREVRRPDNEQSRMQQPQRFNNSQPRGGFRSR